MKMKIEKRIIFLMVIILLLSGPVTAKTEYSVKESRNCPYCHASDGPPQLNERGIYYGTNDHTLEGFAPSTTVTTTPEHEEEIEIGVHMNVWDVGMIAFIFLLFMMGLIYAIKL